MVPNQGKMWSNGIKTTIFQKLTKNHDTLELHQFTQHVFQTRHLHFSTIG